MLPSGFPVQTKLSGAQPYFILLLTLTFFCLCRRTVTLSSSLSESIVPSHRLVALFVSTLSLTIKVTTSCTSCSLIDMSLNIPMLPVANKDDLLWDHLPSSEDIVQVSSDLDSKLSAREYV